MEDGLFIRTRLSPWRWRQPCPCRSPFGGAAPHLAIPPSHHGKGWEILGLYSALFRSLPSGICVCTTIGAASCGLVVFVGAVLHLPLLIVVGRVNFILKVGHDSGTIVRSEWLAVRRSLLSRKSLSDIESGTPSG